ncbi:hypothetical protein DNTS_033342 [Danionella cerebrum]|uniref:CS domain-containing protein n=1 Tax=Danionella cerebrum TaxID=2873325 RepID=A0A553QJP7_9TELE|nr:hypothetical protein DNTS_033342 [Danionella translucida]
MFTVLEMPLIVRDYTWTQNRNTIYISVPLKGIKSTSVDVICTDDYLKVSFPPFLFEVFLSQPINEDKNKECQKKIREQAVLKVQEKAAERSKTKASRIQQEKKYALETMMKLESEEREKIQKMKSDECARATAELDFWRETQSKEAQLKQPKTSTENQYKPVHRDTPVVQKSAQQKEKVVPAPRSTGCIQISFTPRVFPTALRESRVPEEDEWLKKQAEARRAVDSDLAELDDLSEDERNPDWLKDKGDKLFKAGNFLAAVNAYSLGIKLNKKIPALFSNRAACHLKLRNLHKAIEDSSQALELLTPAVAANASSRMKAHVRRGTAFCELQLYVEGLQEYQAALGIDPDNAALRVDSEQIRRIIQGTALTSTETYEHLQHEKFQAIRVKKASVGVEEHVTLCSSSENSDIITLADSQDVKTERWEEPVAGEEEEAETEALYLGSSSSSQYTFRESETNRSPSSSEEEDGEIDGDMKTVEGAEVHPDPRDPDQAFIRGTFHPWNIRALFIIVVVIMGCIHFYGSPQFQERQKYVENELQAESTGELDFISEDVFENLKEDLEQKQELVLSLTSLLEKITKENQNLRVRQEELQAQRQDVHQRLTETQSKMETRQKALRTENQFLKSSLEREKASLSALQEELRSLRNQVQDLEERGAITESMITENQKLRGSLLEEGKKAIQRETVIGELRKELENERRVSEKLRAESQRRVEMNQELQYRVQELENERHIKEKWKDEVKHGDEIDQENQELRDQLEELENKLRFEQQRSDLWERLYLEVKEERAKGDRDVKRAIPKDDLMGKVKETFSAVKNSTTEFVHHHKEKIKKAKEAVKENLRKFSDSVKSTLRHFKDTASSVFGDGAKPEKQETFQQEHRNKRSDDWQPQKPLHSHQSTPESAQTYNTRKPGEPKTPHHNGCFGVFDCAYQESMSLFNKAMDPIRADEFHELLRSYLQKEVVHFHHWRELESFVNNFFRDGVFIHDQMLFTDFVSDVEDYLEEIIEYRSLSDNVFEDLDDYIYRHIFGDAFVKYFGPSRPVEGPSPKAKGWRQCQKQQRKQQNHPRHRNHRGKKLSRSRHATERSFSEVKIELGPMPFDPKY